MYPNALQWTSIHTGHMDNATLLSFMHQVDDHAQTESAAAMRQKMEQFYPSFHAAYEQYDLVFNPSRKSLDTEDLKNLDSQRDDALGAYHEVVLGLQRHPNDAKRQAARQLNLNFDTYKPSRSQEYMKETELITQMTTHIRSDEQLSAAVVLLGLEDYLADLEQKNLAFAQLMTGRTASAQGFVKGSVNEARKALEEKYQLLRQMLNVASIYEGDADYRPFILAVNAEIEHYCQILARKGVSSAGSGEQTAPSGEGTGDDTDGDTGTDTGSGTGEGGSQSSDTGSGDTGSGDTGSGGGSGSDTGTGDTGSDSGGGSGSGEGGDYNPIDTGN